MGPPKAWYKLVNPESVSSQVPLIGIENVDDLKEAIKNKMPVVLKDWNTAQLTLMVSKGCKDVTQAVEVDAETTLVSILKAHELMNETSFRVAPNSYQVDATLVQKTFAENIRLFVSAPGSKYSLLMSHLFL